MSVYGSQRMKMNSIQSIPFDIIIYMSMITGQYTYE